jgi:hypothetical protein
MYKINNEKQVVFPASKFYLSTFWYPLLFHPHRSREQTEYLDTARVFIQVKVWLKRSLSQLEGGSMGRGSIREEEQAVEGNGAKRRGL